MTSVSEELARLAKLRDDGVLTQEQFEQQRERVLAGNAPAAGAAAKPPSNSSKVKIGCGVAAGIVLLLFVIGLFASPRDNSSTLPPQGSAPSASGSADASSGVTMDNYNRIRTGMSYQQVVEILGDRGEELSRTDIGGIETVMYQWNGLGMANMNAMFQDNKLVQKAQFGL